MKTRLTAIASLLLATGAAHAGTAAGTQISNTATATYTDSTSTQRTATSNTVVTTVQQVAAVTLSAGSAKTAAANTTVSYAHTVTNTGNGADSFTLSAQESGAFTMAGVQFFLDANGDGIADNATPITSTGSLAIGGTFKFVAVATLPAGAQTNAQHTLTVNATSVFNNTVKASAADTTTVGTGSSVDITANAAGNNALGHGAGAEASAQVTNTTAPGTPTRFVLYLNNNGGSADTFNLSSSLDNNTFGTGTLPNGWTVVFRDVSGAVITSSTVAAGGSNLVYADVTPAAGATAGTTDVYFRALSPTSNVKDTIHDAVTVAIGATQVTLVKTQAIDAACDGTADTAFSTAPIASALPGACIRYQITATNNGTTDVTQVQIKDDIPANTTYYGGTNPVTATLGSILTVLTGPVTNLTTSAVTLTPGQSTMMSFGVRINP
ncbi:hypothetical protein [uncultured Massilia sp.]|uniref:hypothetical protein n=1 Tax=uncultured Massilia sp. TaxID=169973 RepID=UPI0025DE07F6|nr:hypothetical protein [uncultured Massilia sp.]